MAAIQRHFPDNKPEPFEADGDHTVALAQVRAIEPRVPAAELIAARPVVQAAVVVAGGFVAGAATAAVVRRARARRAVRRGRRGRPTLLPEVVSSRSFLVDVHLLGRE